MNTYKVNPSDPKTLTNYEGYSETSGTIWDFLVVAVVIEIIIILVNLISGGSMWITGLFIIAVLVFLAISLKTNANTEVREKRSVEEADYYTNNLNEILVKSEAIVKKFCHIMNLWHKNILNMLREIFPTRLFLLSGIILRRQVNL